LIELRFFTMVSVWSDSRLMSPYRWDPT